MAIKILFYAVIGIALILSFLFVFNLLYPNNIVDTDFSFEGVIEEMSIRSVIDGTDIITISGKEVLVFPGMAQAREEPIGKIIDSEGTRLSASYLSLNKNDLIGKRVEFFGRKRTFNPEKELDFMLMGKESYYIKLLDYVKSD